MQYTEQVQALIDNPYGDRTPDQIAELCSGALAQDALAHAADPDLLERFARNNAITPDRAAELFEETKRFLVLGRLVGAQLAPSPDIDELWHAWILFTKDYHAFCDKVGGYIHHKPIPAGSPAQPPLEPTVALMEAGYGRADERAWPLEVGARGIMDCKMGA